MEWNIHPKVKRGGGLGGQPHHEEAGTSVGRCQSLGSHWVVVIKYVVVSSSHWTRISWELGWWMTITSALAVWFANVWGKSDLKLVTQE